MILNKKTDTHYGMVSVLVYVLFYSAGTKA